VKPLENSKDTDFGCLARFGDNGIIKVKKIRKVITNYKCKSTPDFLVIPS
jgi:hypothetical protein